MLKKAIVAISFGTSNLDAQKALLKIENRLKAEAPDSDVFCAFTSRIIIKKLKDEHNIHVKTPIEMLEYLVHEGYNCVSCQSLHIIAGIEYEKMQREVLEFAPKFKNLFIGAPLLNSDNDFELCKQIILKHTPPLNNNELLVLMGHGSEHPANSAYAKLQQLFLDSGHQNILMGTVEGTPDFDDVLSKIADRKITKIYLMPFMIVAGEHAQNDLAGDKEDSWKSVLQKKGYEVCPILHGIGEFDEIGDIFATRLHL